MRGELQSLDYPAHDNMEAKRSVFLIDPSKSVWDLTKEDFEYIPKLILLKYWGREINYIWDRLPTHLREDSEVISYQVCREHWNTPEMRDHIDGPPPLIKDCHTCNNNALMSIRKNSSTTI